jgi:hypothetical protein
MTIKINCSLMRPIECTFEVTDSQLDVMVAAGVDVTESWDVAVYYRRHVGETIDGVYFLDLHRIADYEHTGWPAEIEEWDAEGDAPERFWPEAVS